MDARLSSNQGTLTFATETLSLASMLERGIYCMRQGHYAEGVSLFALARDQLTQEQVQFAAVLDTLIRSSSEFLNAQQALLQTSKRLIEVDAEQHMQLVHLEKLLPVLKQGVHDVPQLDACPRKSHDPLIHSPRLSQNETHFEAASHSQDAQTRGGDTLPALSFTCFGRFEAWRLGRPVVLCTNRNGQAILRYLVAKPGHHETVDRLMAMLWPEDEREVAQPKLHIAISAMRRSLNEGYNCEPGNGYILCKNRVYHLNPAVVIRTDVDEFLQCYQEGRQANEESTSLYARACHLYTGPFLSEDIYADWSSLQREQLSQIYIAMCKTLADSSFKNRRNEEAAQWVTAVLKENRCDESAHRQLIQIYAAQGRRSEALQQYQRCVRVLDEDLGVQPMHETILVFQALLANELLPNET
jgi:DNA-binding SARP family transcriptional activator